jgi:hypothetical protein
LITKATVWRWYVEIPIFSGLNWGTSRYKLSDLVLFEAKMQEACTSSQFVVGQGSSLMSKSYKGIPRLKTAPGVLCRAADVGIFSHRKYRIQLVA